MRKLASEGDFLQQRQWLRFGICGIAAGLVNGFFGAGGGMVLVPMLIRYGKLEDKQAFSSAISIILPICLISITVYWMQNIFPFQEALPYLGGGLLGGVAGGLLFRRVTPSMLHKGLGLIILWGGIRLLWN